MGRRTGREGLFELAYVASVVGLTALAVARSWHAVAPASLWLDDQWVAVAATRMSLAELIEIAPPIPPGFLLIERGMARLFSGTDWSLQLVPLLAAVAHVPVMAVLVRLRTGRRALALAAAALILASPLLLKYGVRLKPFTVDSLATLVLLSFYAPALRAYSCRWHAALAACGVVAAFVSFTSVFISTPAVLGAALVAAREGASSRTRVACLVAGGFGLALAGLYLGFFRHQTNPELTSYWLENYLPTESVQAAGAFVAEQGWSAFTAVFAPGLAWLGVLALLGLAALLARDRTAMEGLAFLSIFGGLLLASALHLFPIGGGRTDVFLYAVPIVLAAEAASTIGGWGERAGRGGAPGVVSGAMTISALLLAGWAGAQGPEARYPRRQDARLVRRLLANAGPGDGILLYPHATHAVARYADEEIRVRASPFPCGFDAELKRPGALTLRAVPGWRRTPTLLDPEIDGFLDRRPDRIFYLATHVRKKPHEHILRRMREAGYVARPIAEGPQAELILFRAQSRRR